MEVNPIFNLAVSFVNQTNQPIFLTGKAGTGKTTFLKHLTANSYKKIAVLAPTGVAAINAGGVTIHSFFNLPIATYIPNYRTPFGASSVNVYNEKQLLSKTKLNSIKRDIIKSLDTIIIDEISMVRADILDAINSILQMVRMRYDVPFGGVQMVFIGDMFQLPPVVKEEEWDIMKEYYQSPYFFDSYVMRTWEPIYIELKKIYRQQDTQFIQILNNIRNNQCEPEDLEILNDYYDPYFIPDAFSEFITLTTHNRIAHEINEQSLTQLMAEPITFEGEIKGEFPENAYPVNPQLVLKEGAQVMFIKNDKGETRRFFNGKIGTVSKIDANKKSLFVKFQNDDHEIEVEKETWFNIRYNFNKEKDTIEEEELGSFSQFPLRLAWAVTIHKSQGLTFDKAVIDVGKAFAPGQVYVALSRLTNLEGLKLKSKVLNTSIYTDPRIIEFSKNDAPIESLEQQLKISQILYAEQSILTAFAFGLITTEINEWNLGLTNRNLPEKEGVMTTIGNLASALYNMHQVSQKFGSELRQIFNQAPVDYQKLSQRTEAAAEWFLKIINTQIDQLQSHIDQYKVMPRTKKYIQELVDIKRNLEKKRIQITQTVNITFGLANKVNLTDVLSAVSEIYAPQPLANANNNDPLEGMKPAISTTLDITLGYIQENKTIDEIATKRSMAISTIWNHVNQLINKDLIDLVETNLLEKDRFMTIARIIKQHPDKKLNEYKELLPNEINFEEIRSVLSYFSKKTNHIEINSID